MGCDCRDQKVIGVQAEELTLGHGKIKQTPKLVQKYALAQNSWTDVLILLTINIQRTLT